MDDLIKKKKFKAGEYTQEIKAGILKVNVLRDGTIIMDQTHLFKKEIDQQIADGMTVFFYVVTGDRTYAASCFNGINDLHIL